MPHDYRIDPHYLLARQGEYLEALSKLCSAGGTPQAPLSCEDVDALLYPAQEMNRALQVNLGIPPE